VTNHGRQLNDFGLNKKISYGNYKPKFHKLLIRNSTMSHTFLIAITGREGGIAITETFELGKEKP